MPVPEHPYDRYQPVVALDLRRLDVIASSIEASADPYRPDLTREWTSIYDRTLAPAKPNLLPKAMQTFASAANPGLKAAAGAQVIKLIYFFEGSTGDETIKGIGETLESVYAYAITAGNRNLAGQAQEKIRDFQAQVQSLNHP